MVAPALLHAPSCGVLAPRRRANCVYGDRKHLPRRFLPSRASVSSSAVELVGDPQDAGPSPSSATDASHETDYVVIGSGIGGLCAAAVLALRGNRVTVCESHYAPGGAAHAFRVRGPSGTYVFESGPSFHAGLSAPLGQSKNPLRQVLDLLGESVECKSYRSWSAHLPEGRFDFLTGGVEYTRALREWLGDEAARQWAALEAELLPLGIMSGDLPATHLRYDPGVVLTASRIDPLKLLRTGLASSQITQPFLDTVRKHVTDERLLRVLDLECFLLSGMTAKDTICAEMAFMYAERNAPGGSVDYPIGGTAALVEALVRGLKKHGGRLELRAHVDGIVFEGGRAAGVRLRGKRGTVRATKGVISNASVWDTSNILAASAGAPSGIEGWAKQSMATPMCGSFMHLHVGIRAEGLPAPEDIGIHHLAVETWDRPLDEDMNVINISIPSVLCPRAAPPGTHAIHVYSAANEDFARWEGVRYGSAEYEAMKEARAEPLWRALEKVIPDVRSRAEVVLVGTPLTHARFLRRYRGSYGPAISAASGSFPGCKTPVPGLFVCGDSTQPGIGVPAAAASGLLVANTLTSVGDHLRAIDAYASLAAR